MLTTEQITTEFQRLTADLLALEAQIEERKTVTVKAMRKRAAGMRKRLNELRAEYAEAGLAQTDAEA